MADDASRKLRLPLPTRVVLQSFSLYKRKTTIEAVFDKSVFCLAGANGLGKSTFLAAVNYAITGVVNDPAQRFLGTEDYYSEARAYARSFFDGRIEESDHNAAQVELEMMVGERRYRLVRGMFAPTSLRELTITNADGSVVDLSGPELDDAERHERYQGAVLADSGLDEFSQLVFLQLFVLTFDEARQLLFWDQRRMQAALFITFGGSAEMARSAERLQRTAEKADSLVRNLQWQASGLRDQLKALVSAQHGGETVDEDLRTEHEHLDARVTATAEQLQRLQQAVEEQDVRLADASARLQAAQADYERTFAERLAARPDPAGHPVVLETLEDGRCVVCATAGSEVVGAVRAALEAHICPMCRSAFDPTVDDDTDSEQVARLAAQAQRIEELEREVADFHSAARRLTDEATAAEEQLREEQSRADAFRLENALALSTTSADRAALGNASAGLERQINELLERKERERHRREDAKAELRKFQNDLVRMYVQVEKDFVPEFTRLAYEFLGIDLEIDLDRRASGLELRLSLANSDRREADELSESQRFFLDIALRMALSKQMSEAGHPATLFVDTPEGSLDIAYERRAGRMFGRFVEGDERLFMTANINTSRLLQELATTCGHDRMRLVRMTDWTFLTEVQQEADADFEHAYAEIEARLAEGGA